MFEYIMIPSRPVCCWKKQRVKATQVDRLYFLSQHAWPRVTPLEPADVLDLSVAKISWGSSLGEYTFLIRARASSSFPLAMLKEIDSSGKTKVNKTIVRNWQMYGKP